jgi:hypothetical protein
MSSFNEKAASAALAPVCSKKKINTVLQTVTKISLSCKQISSLAADNFCTSHSYNVDLTTPAQEVPVADMKHTNLPATEELHVTSADSNQQFTITEFSFVTCSNLNN